MAATVNEEFFDALVRHQVGLMRLSPGVANKVDKLLNATEKDLRKAVRKRLGGREAGLDTPVKVRRMNRLLEELKITRLKGWKDINELWVKELRGVAANETIFVDTALKTVSPVILETAIPSAAQIASIAKSTPFNGKVLSEWSQSMRAADLNRIEAQVKIGMLQGESSLSISRRIVGSARLNGTDGVTQITRNQARAVTRTMLNGVANSTRGEYFKQNEDLFTKERYTATLDNRTSLICSSLDGELFPINVGPMPPIHVNCRSLRVAVVSEQAIGDRPARAFTEKQLLKEFTDKNSLKDVRSRDALPRGTKSKFDSFSRTRKRELTGQVPAKVTYQEWLTRQSNAFQDDTLGQTRGKLFRDGGLKLNRFVNRNGDEFTLSELARSDAGAFVAAGFNPKDFL